MVRKNVIVIIALVLIIVAGIIFFWWWFGADHQIKKLLNDLEATASFDQQPTLIAASIKAERLTNYFSPDIKLEIKSDDGLVELHTTRREESKNYFLTSIQRVSLIDIQFLDTQIDAVSGRASLETTARVKVLSDFGETNMLLPLRITFNRLSGNWQIQNVTSIEIIKRYR